MNTVLVILSYSIIGILQIPNLLNKKQRKELFLYCSLFLLAFILSLLVSLGVNIPTLKKPIEKIVTAILAKK